MQTLDGGRLQKEALAWAARGRRPIGRPRNRLRSCKELRDEGTHMKGRTYKANIGMNSTREKSNKDGWKGA